MLFLNAVTSFVHHLEELKRSPQTVISHRDNLTRFYNYLTRIYNRPLYVDEISPDDFEKYIYDSPRGQNFSSSTRAVLTVAFKSFYSFCYKKAICDNNVGKQVAWIKAKVKERPFLTEVEIKQIVAKLEVPAHKAVIQTLYYAGLRVGEALNLKIRDIAFDEGYMEIKTQKSIDNRKIPINKKLETILKEYISQHRRRSSKNDNVFVLGTRGTLSEHHLGRNLRKAAKVVGIKTKVTTHIMRHSFASNLVALGADVVKVQKLLGHRSLATTNIYLHADVNELKKAVNAI